MTETQDRPLGVREDDPPGAKFESFTKATAHGDWSYIVDDFGIAYRHDTLWPFRSADQEQERQTVASLVRQGEKRGEDWSLGDGCGYWAVRIAPDCHYSCGAHGNYVTLWPDLHEAHMASADLHLGVRPQGLGAIVVDCSLLIDLRAMTGTITTWPIGGSPIAADGFSEDFPAELKAQATEKRTKILAFLAAHIARRDAGKRKIDTAHELWTSGQLPG